MSSATNFATMLTHRHPSTSELQTGASAPPFLIMMNSPQNVNGLTFRVVRSLVYLNLLQHPIGPTSSRVATEGYLAAAICVLVLKVRELVQTRSFVGPPLPLHVRIRMEAIEHGPDTPRPFWISMAFSIESWQTIFAEIAAQLGHRYRDDGFLDELGSDPEAQRSTFIVRIECEFLMRGDTLTTGGCDQKGGRESWIQSMAADKRYFRIQRIKTTNNNCAIAAIAHYVQLGGWYGKERIPCNPLRTKLRIAHGVLLSFDELDRVALELKTNYTVYDIHGEKLHIGLGNPTNLGRMANVLSHAGHYHLVLSTVGQCRCGEPDGPTHRCAYKGGFCEHCQTDHSNFAHNCPYSEENREARRVQNQAHEQLKQQIAVREAAMRAQLDARLTAVEGTVADSEEFKQILECVLENRSSCMVIGPGGTGKTFIALHTVKELVEKNGGKVKVFTPTGQAATLVDGATTAHYGLKLRIGLDDLDAVLKRFRQEHYDEWKSITHLLLDEVSMFDEAIVTRIDTVVRHLKRRLSEPFGGCILVAVGDFLQLKPVDSDFLFFDAEVIRAMLTKKTLGVFYLHRPVRYPSVEWFDLLCRVRIGKPSQTDIARLRRRLKPLEEWMREMGWDEQTMPTYACPKVKEADAFNERCINMLKAKGSVTKSFLRRSLKKAAGRKPSELEKLAPNTLELVTEAKVMLLVNSGHKTNYLEEHGVGNGSIGWVHAFGTSDDEGVLVRFEKGPEIFFRHHSFDGVVSQIPLRIAYASSIHRLQGTSLEKAILSLKGCFCDSQAYVALSRVRREENLYLVSLDVPSLSKVDPRCVAMCMASVRKPLPRREMDESGQMVCPLTAQPYMMARVRDRHHEMRGVPATESKVIYVDAETYHNEGMLEAYSIEACRLEHGERTPISWLKQSEETDVLREFCLWLMETIRNDVDAYSQHTVRSAARVWLEKPWVLAAYNGANFDFHMVVKYLFQNGLTSDFRVNMLMKGTTLSYFDIWHISSGKQCLVVHDLCRIVQCSLAAAAKDFLGTNMKGIFPHRHINRHGWQSLLPESQPRTIAREDFYTKEQLALDTLYTKTDGTPYLELCTHFIAPESIVYEDGKFLSMELDLRACLLKYGALDVEILIRLYKAFDTTVNKALQTSVLSFYSVNQLSLYGALIKLPRFARFNIKGKENKFVHSQLFRLEDAMSGWVSSATFGGRTIVRQTHFRSRHLTDLPGDDESAYLAFEIANRADHDFYRDIDALLFLDIFSMYVSILQTREFAYGCPHWMIESELDELRAVLQMPETGDLSSIQKQILSGRLIAGKYGHFILDVEFESHQQDVEPPVPYRDGGGKVCWEARRRRGKYSQIDLALVLRNEGKIHAIHGGLKWPFSGRIFGDYMNTTLQWKQEGEDSGNEALRAFGKLCGNSTFGGLTMRTHSNCCALCTSDEEVEAFLMENQWEGAYGYQSGLLMWGKRKSVASDGSGITIHSPTAKHIGAEVLAYSRFMIDDFISLANPSRRLLMLTSTEDPRFSAIQLQALMQQPYYGDTDSLVIKSNQFHRISSLMRNEPGFWTDDLHKQWEQPTPANGRTLTAPVQMFTCAFGIILEAFFAAPKAYAIRYVLPTTRAMTAGDRLLMDEFYAIDLDGERILCEYNLSKLKEKIRFKGVPRGVPVEVDGTVFSEMNLSLLRQLMLTGLASVDAESETLPPMSARPHVSLSSIGKVGVHPTMEDYFSGRSPFTLRPVHIDRTLFATRNCARKVAFLSPQPASALRNEVLAPTAMYLGNLF